MKLKVNDKEVETGATHLSQFSQEQNLPATGIAIAVNQRMVPRTEWVIFVQSLPDVELDFGQKQWWKMAACRSWILGGT